MLAPASTVVTAVGMASSLGDAVTACAAFRAGLSRATEIPSHEVLDLLGHEMTPVVGHPAWTLTDGFEAAGRWSILLAAALLDLRTQAGFPEPSAQRFWGKTAIVLVTPVLDDARFYYAPDCRPDSVWGLCVLPAMGETRAQVDEARSHLVSCGAAGVAQAVSVGAQWLETGGVDRVIVLAVDSLLDSMSLSSLSEHRRLKCDDNPVGLAPGEAACALLLERPGQPKPLAIIAHVAFDPDGPNFREPGARCNPALNGVLRKTLRARGSKEAFRGDLIADLNGEEWRAAACGAAVASVPASILGDYQLLTAAASFGDTGAASAAIGMTSAVRSFVRGYSRSSESLVLALSDSGESGAVLLRKE